MSERNQEAIIRCRQLLQMVITELEQTMGVTAAYDYNQHALVMWQELGELLREPAVRS